MLDAAGLYHYAYSYCQQCGFSEENLNWVYTLPSPSKIADEFFLRELAWCVFNSGMKEELIRRKWPKISEAYFDFDAKSIINNLASSKLMALQIINYPGKVLAVIEAARRIVKDGPIRNILATMNEQQVLDYLQTFPFIGPITRYHLARNIGFDVVKPDRHLIRVTEFFGYSDCDTFVSEIAAAVGEKKGHVDYILWQWLALAGSAAYYNASLFKTE